MGPTYLLSSSPQALGPDFVHLSATDTESHRWSLTLKSNLAQSQLCWPPPCKQPTPLVRLTVWTWSRSPGLESVGQGSHCCGHLQGQSNLPPGPLSPHSIKGLWNSPGFANCANQNPSIFQGSLVAFVNVQSNIISNMYFKLLENL